MRWLIWKYFDKIVLRHPSLHIMGMEKWSWCFNEAYAFSVRSSWSSSGREGRKRLIFRVKYWQREASMYAEGGPGFLSGLNTSDWGRAVYPPLSNPHPPEMKPSHSWTTWTSDLDVTRKIKGTVSRRRIVYCPQPKNENSQMTSTSDLGTTVYPPSLKTSQRQVGRTVFI